MQRGRESFVTCLLVRDFVSSYSEFYCLQYLSVIGRRKGEGEERERAQHASPSRVCFFSESSQFHAITIEINYALGGAIPASLTRTHRALSQFLYVFPYMIRRRTRSSHGDVN